MSVGSLSSIIVSTIRSIEKNPKNCNVRFSSIQRERKRFCTIFLNFLKSEFKINTLITKWDSKLLDITGEGLVDRLRMLSLGC